MKMLYFSSLSPDSLQQLDEMIETYVPDHALETFKDIENFKERISQPSNSVSVVVVAAEKEALKKLQVLQDQLNKLRLVVILPNKDQETVALCSKFKPRFLSYTSGNFSVVRTVLKKIFSNKVPTVLPTPSLKKATSRNTISNHKIIHDNN